MTKQSVAYSVVPRVNPAKPKQKPRFYAMAQAKGIADLHALSARIERMSTVTQIDVIAVLAALELTAVECLKNGEIVRLGNFGSLQVSISSAGSSTREEFDPSYIRSSHYLFRPGLTLTNALRELNYEQVPLRFKRAIPKRKPRIKARSDIINQSS